MWGQHLKRRGRWWHYYRATPKAYCDVEKRKVITFALRTSDIAQAKLQAAQISLDLDAAWADALTRGVSLCSQDAAERYRAAAAVQTSMGYSPKPAADLSDTELLDRLRTLILGDHTQPEQKALLGLASQPALTLANAFERFWDYIRDEWMDQSADQQRTKRNVYLKSIRNFEKAVGLFPVYELERHHALSFRAWWLGAPGYPAIASLTATSSIDFQELRDQKTALYVLVRQQDMAYYQFLLNLFYTDLFGHLLGSVQPNARPVYLLLDEFGHLAIPNFNVFATTARKYNVGFWLFLQSLSQLEARYGPHDAETILDGLQTEIYLPGVNLDTARRLEQRLGQIADPSGQGRRQPLLTADQIIRLKDNRALLLHSNKRPAMLKTRPYFKQAELRRAADKAAATMPVRRSSTGVLMPTL